MEKPMRSFVLWLCVGAVVLMGVVLGGYLFGLRWNLTNSMPRGIYRRTDAPLVRGQLVAFCLDQQWAEFGQERGYIQRMPEWLWPRECPGGTQPLLKPIVAMEGDTIDTTAGVVIVNGKMVHEAEVRFNDSQGRQLSHAPWRVYRLAPGELWVMSTHAENSWDSRYFGPIREEQVIATAQPIWVWK
jgi:conjugative transfer signal peptidase TraF